jgi:tRNA pseudouridine55 synthase
MKKYRAEMTLGISTSTQDAAGETTEVADDINVTPRQLGDAFATFKGDITQIPPMMSAIRVGGKRLYELARRGEEIERQPRPVRILDLHICKVWPDDAEILGLGSRVLFDVTCSAGTYIRTLCVDVAAKLGCPAHMSFLVRTTAGPFELIESVTFEDLVKAKETSRLMEYILPPEAAVQHLPELRVDIATAESVVHGREFRASVQTENTNDFVALLARVHDAHGRLIAIARSIDAEANLWQPERVFPVAI